tara:strand:- start:7233 stop:7844 length:612 start_codon:yes stop_codon:yes gene_type:complete
MSEGVGWPHDPRAPHPNPSMHLLIEEGFELQSPVESDAEPLFMCVDNNRDYLRLWLPWLDDVTSIDDEISLIRKISENGGWIDGSWLYLIRVNEQIVGVVSLNWVDWNNRSFGLGYWISEDVTGMGIATKSCKRVIQHCFDDLLLHRAVIEAGSENSASISVAERLGMRLEGNSKDREWLYDRFVDGLMYALTAPEWRLLIKD